MPSAPLNPVRTSCRLTALRLGLAAALVAGAAAALPALAAAASYSDASGWIEVPTAVSTTDVAFDFASCPDAPPNQGVDAWVYALPAEVAVAGAQVTVTGEDGAGAVDLVGHVYDDDCRYVRTEAGETPTSGLAFALTETDRYLSVLTTNGIGTALALAVTPPVLAEPTPSPTASSGPGDDVTVITRRDYSGGATDPLYAETSTSAASVATKGQWGMRIIRAAEAWREQQATGAGIRVAVLDSGLDVAHLDFQCEGKIARLDPATYPRFADVTDDDGHGTHVAGIVGACTNNGEGVAGTAPDATLLPVQALAEDDATTDRVAEAIVAATDSGAHVINLSIGFSVLGLPGTGSAAALAGAFASDVDPAIEYAVSRGVVVVAAAGNETFPVCGYPALAEDVVCVGSSDRRDLNAWYGNFPVTPTGTALLAPGGSGQLVFCDLASEAVLSTFSRTASSCPTYPGYRTLDGTSMASPHVAGVAALVYDRLGGARSPENRAAVVQALVAGAVDLYTPGYDPLSGAGRVDALGAVLAVQPVVAPSTPPTDPTPTPSSDEQPATALELVAPATGQTTDEVGLAVRLTAGDQPLAGEPVTVRLAAGDLERVVTGTTDESGVASLALRLDVAPGAYVLSATYTDPDGQWSSASDEQPFEVLRDDSSATLTVDDGRDPQRELAALLVDADTPETPLAGRLVAFFADGREIGTATTDDAGRAVLVAEGRDRAAETYEVRFAGDDTYEPSQARAAG